MHELIYYPTFEVHDPDWIKIALLYLDHLCPIIPESGDHHLSDLYLRLHRETDLIKPYRPVRDEGYEATLDTIEIIEKVLRSPKRYCEAFGSNTFLDRWRSLYPSRVVLFREKYTDLWEHFCLENNFAQKTDHGIAISQDLANVYMSFLSHIISEKSGIPAFTDYAAMDKIAVLSRRTSGNVINRSIIAHGIIKITVPRDISRICLDRIINIRNTKGYKERLHAFHVELDSYISSVENGLANGDFLSTRGSAFSEFTDEIARIGSQTFTVGLGVWLVLSSEATSTKYLKELAATSSLAVNSIIAIRNTWKNTRTKRLTRKYLGTISQL